MGPEFKEQVGELRRQGRLKGSLQGIVWRRELQLVGEHEEIASDAIWPVEWRRVEWKEEQVVWYVLDRVAEGLLHDMQDQLDLGEGVGNEWECDSQLRNGMWDLERVPADIWESGQQRVNPETQWTTANARAGQAYGL